MNDIIAIFNCSPLMYLAKIGFLPFCDKLFAKCITTPGVFQELLQKEHIPERSTLEKAFNSWLTIENPNYQPEKSEYIQMGLHAGEIEVIELAKKIRNTSKSLVIIDDLDAREICHGLHLPVTGTIGILLSAVRKHIISISECEIFVDKLVNTSFYLSARMLSTIRQELDSFK
jgi:predicted nucleic acid-binding protein